MAGGRGILDSNGKLLIRSDGTVDVCEDCCADECPAQVQLTLSGVDATICSGSGWTSLSVDGTYLVNSTSNPNGWDDGGLCGDGTECCFEACFSSGPYAAHSASGTYNSLKIEISYVAATQQINLLQVFLRNPSDCTPESAVDGPFYGGGVAVGEWGANTRSPCSSQTAATGGQAKVDFV